MSNVSVPPESPAIYPESDGKPTSDTSGPELAVYGPDGRRFLSARELDDLRLQAEQRANTEKDRADRAERNLRRVMELSRKVRLGQATQEELAELDRLEAEGAP